MASLNSTADYPPFPEASDVAVRHVPRFAGYAVSDDGNVWTCKNGRYGFRASWRKLKPGINKNGYRHVVLACLGRPRIFTVARLVALVFLGPCPDGMEICHYDGDCKNDRLGNLRWATHAENHADSVRHGTAYTPCFVGENAPRAILNNEDVRNIRLLFHYCTGREIAALFGVANITVSKIKTGRTWSCLPN